ncbi:MAG: hypothetical protein U1F49_17855 [Rubrivivax sp.]
MLGAQALRTTAHQPFVPVIGGQPGAFGASAFGNLYASATAGGEVHRIDRHPTMSRHPGDADARGRPAAAPGRARVGGRAAR